jgi:hypothetical protein
MIGRVAYTKYKEVRIYQVVQTIMERGHHESLLKTPRSISETHTHSPCDRRPALKLMKYINPRKLAFPTEKGRTSGNAHIDTPSTVR